MKPTDPPPPPHAGEGESAREVLASLPAAAVLLRGPEHVFEYANPAATRLLGRDPAGMAMRTAVPELVPQGIDTILDRVYRTGAPYEAPEMDVRLARRPGVEEALSFHVVVSPRCGASGEVVGLTAFAVDVTAAAGARRRAERAERLLSEVFELDPGGIAVVAGPDMRFAFANPAYRAMTPHPERDPVGRTMDEVFPVAEGFGGRAMWDRLAATDADPILEAVERVYPDGRRRSFKLHARKIHWPGGDGLLFVAWETTDLDEARRRAEEGERVARRRAAELDAIVESLPSAITIHDAAGVLVRMNAMADRVWGAIPEHLRHGPSHERLAALGVLRPDGAPLGHGETPVERALAGEVVRGLELELQRRPDAPPARIVIHSAPIRLPGGETAGAVAITEDVSEVRELEQQREDLLRTLSHDVRTPLSVVLTQAELIRRRADADRAEVERRVDAIATSARRIAAMVNDLVEMTQLEAGLVRLRPSPIEFAAFAKDLKDRLRGTLPADRIEVHATPGAIVDADPDRLERIVVNLLTNALKYAEGPVTLSGASSGAGFVVAVSDRGPGIPQADLPRLFQRFFRSSASGETEGSGLGLYVARLLAEAHGGTIRAESEVGKGTTFRVELPRPRAG